MDAATFSKNYGLSAREMEVALAVSTGLNNREVGQKLYITEKCVKFHLTNIYRKTSLKNRTTLTLLLISQGLAEVRPAFVKEAAVLVRNDALPRSAVAHFLPRGA